MRETQEEYSFDNEKDGVDSKKHSVLSVTCRAGRYSSLTRFDPFESNDAMHSSSTWLLLLECILSDISYYGVCILYFFYHTKSTTESSSNHLYSSIDIGDFSLGCQSIIGKLFLLF